MPVSDKTRKVLWGRSGNRCAICKHELIIDATTGSSESVIGEECHIISARPAGPRYDSTYPQEKLDECENLILLCRIHHKMIDDQSDSYTAVILQQMKSNHEIWVSQKLKDEYPFKPVTIRRLKNNIPTQLMRLNSGKEITNLLINTAVLNTDEDELNNEQEVQLVSDFLQTLQDLLDLSSEFGPSDWVRESFSLSQTLNDLEEKGFLVYGAKELQYMEGGNSNSSIEWPVAYLRILRASNVK